MSEELAKKFFDQLEKDKQLQAKVKDGLEKLAQSLGYKVTEEELTVELRKRWDCKTHRVPEFPYSEPPSF